MAHRILQAMTLRQLKPAELAKKAGVSKQLVHGWIKSSSDQISTDLLFQVADALEMNPRWIATGKGSPTPPAEMDPDEAECIHLYRNLKVDPRDAWMRQGRELQRLTGDGPSASMPFHKGGK